MAFLKNIDLLGKTVNWQVEGRDSFATPIGGFLSLIIYLGTLALTWYFGKDIYERDNPKFIAISEYLPDNPFINLNSTFFAMLIYDYDGKAINDPRAYRIEAWQYITNYTNKGEEVSPVYNLLKFEKCTNQDVEEPFYTNQGFQDFYCPNFNFSYGGTYTNSHMVEPYVNIVRCSKEDEDQYGFKCYSDEELAQKFGNLVYLAIKVQNNFLNPKNYTHPIIKNYIESGYFISSTGNQYALNIAHKIASLTSDTGLIFEDENRVDFFQRESTDFYTVATIEKGKAQLYEFQVIFQICFFISRNIVSYRREYIKIPDALANVGGFMGIIIEIITLLFSIYLENEYSIFLYRNLFKLEVIKEDNIEGIQRIELNIELNNMKTLKEMKEIDNVKIEKEEYSFDKNDKKESSRRVILGGNDNSDNININKPRKSKIIVKPNIINKEVRNLIKYKEKKREIIVIGKCERFCFLSCCCKSKKVKYNSRLELIKNAEAEISKKFDVIENLKSQNQMRLLKKLLLNENQCYLLENRELHILNNDKNHKNTTISSELEDINLLIEKQKTDKLFEYLKIKKQENSFSVVDTLLIKYLNEELKNKIKTEIDID